MSDPKKDLTKAVKRTIDNLKYLPLKPYSRGLEKFPMEEYDSGVGRIKHGEGKKFFGLELEFELDAKYGIKRTDIFPSFEPMLRWIAWGSEGVYIPEAKLRPMTLDFLRDNPVLFEPFEYMNIKWLAPEQDYCGLHITVDAEHFRNPSHLNRFTQFLYLKKWDSFQKIMSGRSVRSYNRWCLGFRELFSRDDHLDPIKRANIFRGAINEKEIPKLTRKMAFDSLRDKKLFTCRGRVSVKESGRMYEIRLFRGTLSTSEILAKVEFVHSLIEWSSFPKNTGQTLPSYHKAVVSCDNWPHLKEFMKRKERAIKCALSS